MLSASVIVPTYNRPAALSRTLDALRAMDFRAEQLEIVVVDTGAADREVARLAGAHDARYLRPHATGVAAARNHGAAIASAELLMFVDDDIVVGESNLVQHQAIHARHDRCLVSGHWEFDPDLRRKLELSPLGRYRLAYEDLYNKPDGLVGDATGQVHPATLSAANLSVTAETFRSLGGFDERFPVAAEDQDLTWRAARAGCLLVYDYDIRVIHNDQHSDFVSLCRRQERAAVGAVCFSRKNRDAPTPAMLTMNGPVRRADSPRMKARKLSRALLSNSVTLAIAQRAVRVVELLRPDGGWPLEALYRAVGGLYVFRGTRRGLTLTANGDWQPAHQSGL